ncbi:5538_t:CDS:2 [Acaulospora colombiana]|uniref:5538_t:CDS:1 n=1 Tax=Acaulospora colombiana TaxID=27376 RepID=A0ACA9KG56_9GLOM|nr:5538_t:CDS:2 [Acaulospora colombiana]
MQRLHPLRICKDHGKRLQSTIATPDKPPQDVESLRSTLRGTVPKHQSLLLLHTKTPTTEWPSLIQHLSPVIGEVLLHQKEFQSKVLLCNPRDRTMNRKAVHLLPNPSQAEKHFTATLFTKLTEPLDIPVFQREDIPKWVRLFKERTQDGIDLQNMLHGPEQARSMMRSSFKSQEIDKARKKLKKLWVLVCTHGSRDCRCGEHGPQVADAVQKYISKKRLEETVVCGEVSHVGGHK